MQGKQAILWDYNKSFFTWRCSRAQAEACSRATPMAMRTPRSRRTRQGAVAAAAWEGLIKNGHMPRAARYANMEAGFNRGEIAMMISGPWAWDNAKKPHRFRRGAHPRHQTGQPSRPFVGVLGCMIASPATKDLPRVSRNHVLKPGNLKIINDDVPLGAGQQGALPTAFRQPAHQATMENALGRTGTEHSGDGPLLVGDGCGTGSDHQWPAGADARVECSGAARITAK